ncbi:MAG: hypothetical protein ABMA26_00520 [Limisphaerales bacterium]
MIARPHKRDLHLRGMIQERFRLDGRSRGASQVILDEDTLMRTLAGLAMGLSIRELERLGLTRLYSNHARLMNRRWFKDAAYRSEAECLLNRYAERNDWELRLTILLWQSACVDEGFTPSKAAASKVLRMGLDSAEPSFSQRIAGQNAEVLRTDSRNRLTSGNFIRAVEQAKERRRRQNGLW